VVRFEGGSDGSVLDGLSITGERLRFSNLKELCAYLESHTGEIVLPSEDNPGEARNPSESQ
jgi:DNA-binding Xre family transcriptional regulator